MKQRRHKVITLLKAIEPESHVLQGYVTRPQLAVEYRKAECTIAVWQRRDGMPVHRIGTQPVYKLAEVAAWFRDRPNRMHGGRRVA